MYENYSYDESFQVRGQLDKTPMCKCEYGLIGILPRRNMNGKGFRFHGWNEIAFSLFILRFSENKLYKNSILIPIRQSKPKVALLLAIATLLGVNIKTCINTYTSTDYRKTLRNNDTCKKRLTRTMWYEDENDTDNYKNHL